ncbi:helix-turn-helix transcriptional regulator [Rhizobium sp. SYY.PMSO]|uniref:helix-turn-helix transcriptional regulator n=1 Tax=Rhizobium sp. SYY.PMSO TaxID=3382192 RepID=UPI0039901A88
MSYELKIDPKKRAGSRFIGKVRKALVTAIVDEKSETGINQQKLATALGVHRSVINRMLKGDSNITLRSIGELAWALGWEPDFTMKRRVKHDASNGAPEHVSLQRKSAATSSGKVAIYSQTNSTKGDQTKFVEAAE